MSITSFTVSITDYATARDIFSLAHSANRALRAGMITPTQANRWLDELVAAGQAGHFFSAVTVFVVSGCKPQRPG